VASLKATKGFIHLAMETNSFAVYVFSSWALGMLKSSSGKGMEFVDLLWNFRGNRAKSNDVKKE
ncbi:hypothetical protein Tco_0307535, partial [Tanacetum coccineum]